MYRQVRHSLEHCLWRSHKLTLVTEPFLSVHVLDVPLVRLLRSETSFTLDTSDQRVWHQVMCSTHVIGEQRKCLERHITAGPRTPGHINTSMVHNTNNNTHLSAIFLHNPGNPAPECHHSGCSARAGVAPMPGRCSGHFTGFQWDSGSPTKWLCWPTRCGPQPLQRISVTWYRPRTNSDSALIWCFTAGRPTDTYRTGLIALSLSQPHPSGTLYLLTFDCARAFPYLSATWKPICLDLVLLCCCKCLCILGPHGAIEMCYYYYYYWNKMLDVVMTTGAHKTCKTPAKSSLSTYQLPTFCRPDALPVT